ncbi:uncharacterized protein [Prorops nasuta]|uniref:uncharacterized protein isoform X1 n=1 Tax=Prorops nasuta TaxID=863751 RepID=UPI0034CD4536
MLWYIWLILDDMYTPIYCQKRCNSLRDQYNREKRKALECRSGSGAVKQSSFLYLRQLSFLDKIVKRRRSYTNSSINKNNNNDLLNNLQESNKQVLDEECINTGDTEPNIMKRRKVHETKSLETAFLNMGDTISEYMKKKKTEMDSVDDAFMKYLKLQFDTFSDNEKLIRKKMIMDALVARIE